MPPDHNQQHQRRPHYHRGRRGPDRRGGERRPQPQQTETGGRDQLDIEQIMREIRSRISEQHGIDLTNQQIQELAARRLEAILDPRAIKPSLMDELRRSAGLPADVPPSEPEHEAPITESSLYASENGLLRVIRRLLNPVLKLVFNPAAIVKAFNGQAQQMKAAAGREAEQRRRQTEWNALHFEILRRLVTDIARVEIDNQHLAHRIESLTARVDFNERRVRNVEHSQLQSRTGRAPDAPLISPSSAPTPREDIPSAERASTDTSPDANRRRRRRRRGRRSGQPRDLTVVPTAGLVSVASVDQIGDGDEFADEDTAPEELADEAEAPVALADDQAAVESVPPAPDTFEPPSPSREEPAHVASSELENATGNPEDSRAPAVAESSERPDPVPPEQS